MGADGDGVVVGMDVVCFWCFFGGGDSIICFCYFGGISTIYSYYLFGIMDVEILSTLCL